MSTNNWTFIIAAYTVAWLGVIGYWIFVHRAVRQAREVYDRAIAAATKTAGSR
jgi:hypothetical protein